jgi:hypothetical protein
MWGHPLALDYDRDNIIDLFGVSPTGVRTIWLSRPERTNEQHPFSKLSKHKDLLVVNIGTYTFNPKNISREAKMLG